MNPLRLEARGLIYDAIKQPTSARIAFFTSLVRLTSGELLCAFQYGSAKHSVDSKLAICRSTDEGNSWAQLDAQLPTSLDGIPGSLTAPAICETSSGRLLLFATWLDRSDPQRPLFDPVTQGILHSRLLIATSHDKGDSWSAWRVVATPGLTGCSGTGPILRWSDGTLALAFESFKEFDDPRPGRHGAWMMISDDDGESFSLPLLVARDPDDRVYYWDQRLCTTGRDGEFAGLFWTHDITAQRDRHVHLSFGVVNRRSHSSTANEAGDGAAGDGDLPNLVSGAPRETTISGQISAPLRFADGRLAALVVCRHSPCTMTLWQSFDDGATWPEESRLVVYQHDEHALVTPGGEPIDFNQYWEDMGKWSFGHPAICPLDDERALCAYYAGSPDCMSIHWARVSR